MKIFIGLTMMCSPFIYLTIESIRVVGLYEFLMSVFQIVFFCILFIGGYVLIITTARD